MAFLQKTWKDRVAEYINRRVLTKEDGTTELVSVERSEGTISQEGDAFSAANMNDLEQRIANEFSEQNKKFEWKLAGGTTTGEEVLLPSDFTELNILHSTPKSNYVIHMCRELVSDVGYNISNGYYVSADNSDVTTIFVSQTKVKGMYNVSQIVVYYR